MTVVAVGAIGSLLGLLAHDLAAQALRDEPLRPFAGTCPRCGHRRGWASLTCDECGRSVRREILLALVAGAVAVGFYNTIGLGFELVPYGLFLLLSSALIMTDLDAFRLVDRLNIPGTFVLVATLAVAALVEGASSALFRGLGGAAVYFGGASLVFLAVRGRGFGAGDVKLAVQLGLFTAYLSWGALGWSVFITAALGGVIALAMVAFGSAGLKSELPYGPPMILGAWAAIVFVGVGAIPVPS